MDVPGLVYFRIEALSSDRVVVWESALVRASSSTRARRTKTIRGLDELESGVYFFRIVALTGEGDPFPEQDLRDPNGDPGGKRTNETEDFLLIHDLEREGVDLPSVEAVLNATATNYADAELLAARDAGRPNRSTEWPRPREMEWTTPVDGRAELTAAVIRFDLQHQYSVKLSQRLRRLELNILDHPGDGGHRRITLALLPNEADPTAPVAVRLCGC